MNIAVVTNIANITAPSFFPSLHTVYMKLFIYLFFGLKWQSSS